MSDKSEAERKYLEALNSRAQEFLTRLNESEPSISMGYIALDLIRSMVSAYSGGVPVDKVEKALPTEWQKMVPVPIVFLELLSSGWERYLEQNCNESLGQSLGIEGRGMGKKEAMPKTRKRDFHQKLSNRVSVLLLEAEERGQVPQVAAEINQVAKDFDVSETTVRTAWRKFGRPHMEAYRRALRVQRSGDAKTY